MIVIHQSTLCPATQFWWVVWA